MELTSKVRSVLVSGNCFSRRPKIAALSAPACSGVTPGLSRPQADILDPTSWTTVRREYERATLDYYDRTTSTSYRCRWSAAVDWVWGARRGTRVDATEPSG